MDAVKQATEVLFRPEIFQTLVNGLPRIVERLNLEEGAPADAAQNEIVVQREIMVLLKSWLPCSTLVRQNRILVRDEEGACMPDVTINEIGAGCWAAIELKLELASDFLPTSLIKRDFEKLYRYKLVHPSAQCIFLLVASTHSLERRIARLSDGRPVTNWENPADALVELLLDDLCLGRPYAVRTFAFSDGVAPTCALAWEIVQDLDMCPGRMFEYRFTARMSA